MDNAGQRVTKDDLIDAVSWQLAKFMRVRLLTPSLLTGCSLTNLRL